MAAYRGRPYSPTPPHAQLAEALSGGRFGPMGSGSRPQGATFTAAPAPTSAPATGPAGLSQQTAYGGRAGQTDAQRAMAQAIMGQGISSAPAQGWMGALARALQAPLGAMMMKKA